MRSIFLFKWDTEIEWKLLHRFLLVFSFSRTYKWIGDFSNMPLNKYLAAVLVEGMTTLDRVMETVSDSPFCFSYLTVFIFVRSPEPTWCHRNTFPKLGLFAKRSGTFSRMSVWNSCCNWWCPYCSAYSWYTDWTFTIPALSITMKWWNGKSSKKYS